MADALEREVDAWLDRARDDLGAAGKLLSGNDPFPAPAAYHCQQVAEKALKAMIAATGVAIPRTHDLRVLLGRCIGIDPTLDEFYDTCDELTPYATEFRYPSDVADPGLDQVLRARALLESLLTGIVLRIQKRFARVR